LNRLLARALIVLISSTGLALAQSQPTAGAAQGKTQLTWYGQSAFRIVTPSGRVLLIDPWISNPLNMQAKSDLAGLTKVDLILVSHGHFDHVGDAVAIGKQTRARLVTTFELGSAMARYLGFPKDQMGSDSLGNVGGSMSFFDGEVKVTFVPAVHSSSVQSKEGKEEVTQPAGTPVGFLVAIRNGPTLYHTGDTDVFGDMQLLRPAKVTLMLACIGDHYTMGPERAAEAVNLVQPGRVVAMHYGTLPVLTGTPAEFVAALQNKNLLNRYQPLSLHGTLDL
jgi:L-ascorbate metabolism protein UlaG (beta-lactamase superfamily)